MKHAILVASPGKMQRGLLPDWPSDHEYNEIARATTLLDHYSRLINVKYGRRTCSKSYSVIYCIFATLIPFVEVTSCKPGRRGALPSERDKANPMKSGLLKK